MATELDLFHWWVYLSWRAKAALRAHERLFGTDGTFRAENPYERLLDVHAFFTHAAMVARVFHPSAQGGKQSAASMQRAELIRKHIGLQDAPLKECLAARNNLDHYDERIDIVAQFPDADLAPLCYQARRREDFSRLGSQKRLLMLGYVKDEQAIVTYSRSGEEVFTPVPPILRELQYIFGRSRDFIDRENRR